MGQASLPRRLSTKAANRHKRLRVEAHKDGTYESLLKAQDGRCAICRRIPDLTRRLDIDHDHRTGVIRGLLCRGCNMRLRKDHNPDWLRAAADYLDGEWAHHAYPLTGTSP